MPFLFATANVDSVMVGEDGAVISFPLEEDFADSDVMCRIREPTPGFQSGERLCLCSKTVSGDCSRCQVPQGRGPISEGVD